jgi:protein JSN1
MNTNGTLLINWLLDSSQLPRRYKLLAKRFTSSLAQLCCHKLAAVTVFKVINQSIDPEASRSLLATLIDEQSSFMEEILSKFAFLVFT